MTIEMTIILQEIPASTVNATTAEKEATRLLVFGRIKEKRNIMTSTTYSWDIYYVYNFKKKTMKKISKNG